MATLEDSLEALNTELERADGRFAEAEKRSAQTGVALGLLRDQVSTEAHKVLPLAEAVTALLQQRGQEAQEKLSRLQGDLGGLETDLRERKEATHARVRQLQPVVEQLSGVLQKVHSEFRAEQQATESALVRAAERSQQAYARSRTALEALELYAREDFVPRLALHEQSTETARERLLKKVVDTVLPTLEAQVQELRGKIEQVVRALSEQANLKVEEARTQADQDLAEVGTGARARVQELANQTTASVRSLGDVTALLQSEQGNELRTEQALLQALQTAIPHLQEVRKIPVRLEEVLKKARVIH